MPENANVLDALVDLVAQRITTKDVGTTANGTRGHGAGGIFSQYGINQNIVNAMILPQTGLLSKLPVRASNMTHEKYGILTGVTGESGPGTQSEDECGDCQTAGLMKLCTFSTPFGRFCLETKTYDITRLGERINRSEFMDYRLVGGPLMNDMPPMPASNDPQQALNSDIAKFLFEFQVGYLRIFARKLVYTGNPANSIGNGLIEPRGLDILINKGYQDAETGVLCPAADSLIRDFGSLDVGSNGATAVNTITYMMRYFRKLADDAGLSPVNWTIVMTPGLFYELTAVWPCSYLSYRCTPATGTTNNTNATDIVNMRDAMRQGEYLTIDGVDVPVTLDSSVAETYADGEYTSQIYFVPLTIAGGMPATFIEYFNMNAPGGAAEAARLLGVVNDVMVTPNGRYIWTRERNKTCFKWGIIERPRIVLQASHLAGRLTNVKYAPLIHERGWSPSDDWFYNGGGTSTTAPSYNPPNIYDAGR